VILGVLDESPVPDGLSRAKALENSLDLAIAVEAAGYRRHWVTEHHGVRVMAGVAPELLVAEIAAATHELRVGTGGVLLTHYSPYKVAECFEVLTALHPGRIDLGIGRSRGADDATAVALRRDRRLEAADDFDEQFAELLGYVRHADDASEFASWASADLRPEVWLLGSSDRSANFAAALGVRYAFADFNNYQGATAVQTYRTSFRASSTEATPYVMVAIAVVCADTSREARILSTTLKMSHALRRKGSPARLPTPTEAREYIDYELRHQRLIVGDPGEVKREIEAVAAAYGADEVLVITVVHDHEARKHSYRLLADAFGMSSDLSGRSLREA